MTARTRVIVADDDPMMAEVLSELVASTAGWRCVAVCADGHEVLAALDAHPTDVLVTDLRMPGGGADLVRTVVTRHPSVRVLVLTAADRAAVAEQVISAGASAIVSKSRTADLADAIQRCADGQVVIAVPGAVELVRGWLRAVGP